MTRLIDISTTIEPTPDDFERRQSAVPHRGSRSPYKPSDHRIEIAPILQPDQPGSLGRTTRKIMTPLHVATHIDAPEHRTKQGMHINDFPLETFMGKALVADMRHKLPRSPVTAYDLETVVGDKIEDRDRLIIRTDVSKKRGTKDYYESSPYLSRDAAEWCVRRKMKILALDFYPWKFGEEFETGWDEATNRHLLSNGVLLLTNITNLDQITKERVTLVAFPLKIKDVEASPVRAVVIEE